MFRLSVLGTRSCVGFLSIEKNGIVGSKSQRIFGGRVEVDVKGVFKGWFIWIFATGA